MGHSPSWTFWSPAMQMDLYLHCCTGRSCNHLCTELNHCNHADHFFSRRLRLSCCTCCGAFTKIVSTTLIHHLLWLISVNPLLQVLILATVGRVNCFQSTTARCAFMRTINASPMVRTPFNLVREGPADQLAVRVPWCLLPECGWKRWDWPCAICYWHCRL